MPVDTATDGFECVIEVHAPQRRIYSFISLDKLTNEEVSKRADSAFISDEVKGVVFTDAEKQARRDGKAVFIESTPRKEFIWKRSIETICFRIIRI